MISWDRKLLELAGVSVSSVLSLNVVQEKLPLEIERASESCSRSFYVFSDYRGEEGDLEKFLVWNFSGWFKYTLRNSSVS